MKKVFIKTENITLEQLLKWSGAVSTGGEAKILIQQGEVKLNNQIETRRSKKIIPGDIVEIRNQTFLVEREFNETR